MILRENGIQAGTGRITVLKIDSNGAVAGRNCYYREGNTKPWSWRGRGETSQSRGAHAD